jgi:polar amino acid transport system substrate-binding protein
LAIHYYHSHPAGILPVAFVKDFIRMIRFARCALVLCLLFGLRIAGAAEIPRTLRACGDSNEFAPFSYFQRDNGRPTSTVAGFNVEVLQAIMAEAGHDATIVLVPWARCISLATRGDYDIVLDGVKSPIRERDFLMPASHYRLKPVFLYLKDKPPPPMRSNADLATQRICSQRDYNYEPFGIPDKLITNRARTIDDAAEMLRRGRCSIMLQEYEILQAYSALNGKDLLASPDLDFFEPKWIKEIDFYFLVGRSLPYGNELVRLLDRGIARMRKSGELERLRNKQHIR